MCRVLAYIGPEIPVENLLLKPENSLINQTLDPHEQLKCLVVVTTAWTVDNDLITPTFKVKRNRIEDLYARQYESWESSGKKVIWQ